MKEGSLVSSKYRVIRLLGRGGTGSVWLADDINSGDKVALKVINEEYRGKGIDNLLRFKKEADVLQGLDHPKIAKLREFDFHGKYFFIAMDFIDGLDLDRFSAGHRPMGLGEFFPIAKDLCRTLVFIHANHVVHGDLKPNNIIVDDKDGVLSATLLDFGVSSLLLTDRHAVERSLGAYAYMSPEQFGAIKRGADSRSDLYSLGIIFYFMLSGQVPYTASSVYALMHQHIAAVPSSIVKRNPAVPALLERIVFKLMSKEAQERYQTATGLLKDIEELERRVALGEADPDFPMETEADQAAVRGKNRFVGREQELAFLMNRFDDARAGSGSVTLIKGPAGSGKTRLAEAFRRNVLRSGGIAIGEDHHEYGKTTPYGAIMMCINRFCEMASFYSRDKREALMRDLRLILGDLGALVVGYLPALRQAIPPSRDIERLKGDDEKKRFEDLVLRVMDRLSSETGAAVFFIDDLQWADRSTIDFISRLSSSRAERHYLVLCAIREGDGPERSTEAEASLSGPGINVLELGPLSFENTRRIVAEYPEIGEDQIWPVTEKVFRRTGGNPLFILELLKLLREKGLLGKVGDSDYPALQDLPYSESVASIIRESLERHPEPFKRVISRLSVLGKEFALSDAFSCFESIPQQDLLDAIALARREGILSVSGDQASFEHDIIHKHFYLQLSEDDRMDAHETVAEFFASHPEDQGSAYRAAQHFARSANVEKAIRGLAEAGAIALSRHSFADSIAFFLEAKGKLDALADGKEKAKRRTEILIGLGEAYSYSGFHAQARKNLEEAVVLADTSGERARIEALLGSALIEAGEFDAAGERLNRALALLGEKAAGKPGLLKELLRYFHRPPWARASTALSRAAPNPAVELRMSVYEKLGLICFWRGKSIPILASHFKSLNFIDRLGASPSSLRIICVHTALLISFPWPKPFFRGVLKRISRLMDTARDMKDAIPGRGSAHYLYEAVHAAIAFFIHGRLMEAKDSMERSMESYWKEKTAVFLQEITSIYSQILEAAGDIQGLGRLAYKTEEIGVLYSNPIVMAYARCYRGMYLHLSGNDAEAESLLENAIQEFVRRSDKVFQVIAGKYRIRALYKLQRRLEAQRLYGELVEFLQKNGLVHPVFSAIHAYPAEDALLSLLNPFGESGPVAKASRLDAAVRKALKRFKSDREKYAFLEPMGLRLDVMEHGMENRTLARDEAFREALALSGGRSSPLERGLVEYAYAIALSRENPARAEEELGRALLVFDKCGAWREKNETRSLLREFMGGDAAEAEGKEGPSLKTYQELDAVLNIGKKIGYIHDLSSLLSEVLAQSIELVGAEQGEIFLYENGAPVSKIRSNMPSKERVPTCSGVVSRVDFSGEPILVQNAMTDPHLMNDAEVIAHGLKSIICVPILSRDKRVGVLYLSNRQVSGLFSEHELDILVALAGEAAVAIENTTLFKQTKELQTRLETILDSMPTGIVALDQDGRVVQINQAAIGIFPALKDADKSMPFWDAMPELERYRPAFIKAVCKGASVEMPDEAYGQRDVQVTVFPLRGGDYAGAALKLNDVSVQKRTQEELIRVQKMEAVGTLISGLTHDFNNILAGIKATAQYLLQFVVHAPAGPDIAELDEQLRTINSSVGSATELVDQLMTISKKREAATTRVDLLESIRHVLKVCRASFDRSVSIECSLPEGKALVLADPVQIEQVLLNVLINASHAMTIMREPGNDWGGTLALGVSRVGSEDAQALDRYGLGGSDYWRIAISDTGVGMKPNIREKIFEPFFSTKKSGKGTGLGLAMTYGIILALKGRIDVASVPGKGSTFTIHLPVSSDGRAPLVPVPIAAHENAGTKKGSGRVLIIDDDRMLRKAIAKSLEIYGWEVIQAEDGLEGERLFESERESIDFVILDVFMPKQDGDATFRRIRELSPRMKVIVTSGFRKDERVTRLMDSGADCFLLKPYDRDKLGETIRGLGFDLTSKSEP